MHGMPTFSRTHGPPKAVEPSVICCSGSGSVWTSIRLGGSNASAGWRNEDADRVDDEETLRMVRALVWLEAGGRVGACRAVRAFFGGEGGYDDVSEDSRRTGGSKISD